MGGAAKVTGAEAAGEVEEVEGVEDSAFPFHLPVGQLGWQGG